MQNKKCSHCKQIKPLEDYYKNRSKKDGLSRACKICHAAQTNKTYRKNYLTKYRQANKEKLKAKKKQYYEEHKIEAIERASQWSENNPQKRKQIRLKWRLLHRQESSTVFGDMPFGGTSGEGLRSCLNCSRVVPKEARIDKIFKDYSGRPTILTTCKNCRSREGEFYASRVGGQRRDLAEPGVLPSLIDF